MKIDGLLLVMMVMCNGIVITEHDRRRPGLPNAPVVIEHDNNRIEEFTAIALNMQTSKHLNI